MQAWTPEQIITLAAAVSAILLHIPPVMSAVKSVLAALPRPGRSSTAPKPPATP